MYLKIDEIRELHVEVTNKCNAACPMCDRNIFGSNIKAGRGLDEWSIEDIQSVFSNELPNLECVYFCGTHGDPLVAKNLFFAVEAAKTKGARIEIFTNGSLRSKKWWLDFLEILDKNDRISFGIDGIETNHLYRRNTNIDIILRNLDLVCKSKTQAKWDFLAFKHNEHEVEKCKELAVKYGVDEFRIRRTARFDTFDPFPVLDKKGNIEYYLEQPDNQDLRHPDIEKMKKVAPVVDIKAAYEYLTNINSFGFAKSNLNSFGDYEISCLYKKNKRIYVNSRLEVFPCCYISDHYETYKKHTKEELEYPVNELTLRKKTWNEILNNSFFNNDLESSWTDVNVIPRCIKTCGVANREQGQILKQKI